MMRQARRPDRRARARDRRETETRDTGQVIAQTGKHLVPRAADNFYYFAEMCTRVDGHTYPTPTHLNYTLLPPGGRVRADQPVERAVHDRHLEDRAVPRLRQHRGAEDERAVADDASRASANWPSKPACPRACSTSCTATARTPASRCARTPTCARSRSPARTATGNRIVQTAGLKKFSMELGGKSPFVIFDDADLDRALDAAIFMIFSNNGERCTAGSRILVQQVDLRRLRAALCRARQAHHRRRPAGRQDHRRPDDQPGGIWPRCAATSSSAPRGRHADVRRARRAGRCRPR